MTQQHAARVLNDHFYEWCPAEARPGEYIPKIRMISGFAIVPKPEHQPSMDHRRAQLLPEGFRFTWSYLPHGAHYV